MTPVGRLAMQRVRAIRALNTRGIRLLHIADMVTIYLMLLAVSALMTYGRSNFDALAHLDRYVWSYAVVALLHLAVFYFGGLYDRERRLGPRPGLPKIVALVWVASLLAGLISWMLGEFLLPRSILAAFAVVAPPVLAGNRWLSRRLRLDAEGPPRVLLVGDDEEAAMARRHLLDTGDEVSVVGETPTVDGIEKEVDRTAATDVLLLDSRYLGVLYAGPLARLEHADVGALQIVSPRESLLGLRNVGEIGGIPFVGLSTHVLPPSQARLKRYLDLTLLVLSLPVVLPLAIGSTMYAAAAAGRPLLFVQQRVGRDGTLFSMMKFRTMRRDAEDGTGPVAAAVNDPRILRGMHWVRHTRLDELPQLWHVLRGEMSIVGPRPERPEEMAEYERLIPGYRRRHQVPPGITGLAQVYGYARTDPGYKLGHDLHYLANWSPILDLQIIARTAWVVATRRG